VATELTPITFSAYSSIKNPLHLNVARIVTTLDYINISAAPIITRVSWPRITIGKSFVLIPGQSNPNMSIFSRIKRTRQQAKEHSAKETEKNEETAIKLPYKHVPTHAAVDALSGAPSSWQHEYRPRILEQNRKRSAVADSVMHPNPRTSSLLPYVSYPSIYAAPALPSPSNYSFGRAPAGWEQRVSVDSSQEDFFRHSSSRRKGKELDNIPPSPVGIAVPMARSGRTSAVSNKGNWSAQSLRTII
jgi:hypothetical protein